MKGVITLGRTKDLSDSAAHKGVDCSSGASLLEIIRDLLLHAQL